MKLSDLPEQQVQEICEEFAKMEGVYKNIPVYKKIWNSSYTDYREVQDGYRNPRSDELSDYPNDKNAMGRIIEGMDEDTCLKYVKELLKITRPEHDAPFIFGGWWIVRSSCHEQFIAAALALGLIKEGR